MKWQWGKGKGRECPSSQSSTGCVLQNGGPLRTLDLEQASACQKTPALQGKNEPVLSFFPYRLLLRFRFPFAVHACEMQT